MTTDDITSMARAVAQRLRECPERGRTTFEAADIIEALCAEVERLDPLQYRQAPCHKFCEANAFKIEIRGLRKQLEAPLPTRKPLTEDQIVKCLALRNNVLNRTFHE